MLPERGLTYCSADKLSQAKGDACRQKAEQNLPPARFPEGGTSGETYASADAKQAKYAENDADCDSYQATGEDKWDYGNNRADSEEEKRSNGRTPGRSAKFFWINSQFFARQGIQGVIALLHQAGGQFAGRFLFEALRFIDER